MKKIFKKRILAVVLSCFTLMNVIALPVHASTVNETEPNNTRETAMTITANRETPAQAVSGNRPNEYVVDGSTSANDEDWYKVYLNAGVQYVTLNGGTLSFEVYEEDSEFPIIARQYQKTGFGGTAYRFNATTAGFYYVCIHTNLSSSQDYLMLVGDPTYDVISCTVNLDSVTMSGSDQNVSFNLVNETSIPEGAIVYSMAVRGVRTTAVDGIAVRNITSGNTVNMDRYTWSKSGLVSLSMPVRGSWRITFEYSKNTTFTPYVVFQCVYPVTSVYAEDITITP